MANLSEAVRSKTVKVVFISLLLDLLAFTIPLPLFPRLIDDFLSKERFNHQTSLLSASLSAVRLFRSKLLAFQQGQSVVDFQTIDKDYRRWDITLLGGLLGSIFSFAQFIVSPSIGRLSDSIGRKPVLLLTMAGNILSGVLWLFSTTFDSFLLARLVGGLCEGNVQLAIAIMSDVSSSENRAKSLALVGLAFSMAFTTGPPLGAYFASRPLSKSSLPESLFGLMQVPQLNIYATPALVTVLLLTVETLYLYISLPETTNLEKVAKQQKVQKNETDTPPNKKNKRPAQERNKNLNTLNRLHFAFLFLFSGCEFSLTFLTYDLFRFTNMQNGKLLGYIGIVSALLQGGYVRRIGKPAKLSKHGLLSCCLALLCLSVLPFVAQKDQDQDAIDGYINTESKIILFIGANLLAFTSATVVTSLNALTSLQCDDDNDNDGDNDSGKDKDGQQGLSKGVVLGRFRSVGQLGRSVGPIFATSIYWGFGPSVCYGISGIALAYLWKWTGRDWEKQELKVEKSE